jgi:hypothetical protein
VDFLEDIKFAIQDVGLRSESGRLDRVLCRNEVNVNFSRTLLRSSDSDMASSMSSSDAKWIFMPCLHKVLYCGTMNSKLAQAIYRLTGSVSALQQYPLPITHHL